MTELPIQLSQLPDATPGGGVVVVQPNDPLQTCRVCRYEFRASAKLLGKKIPCSHCGALVEIISSDKQKDDPLVGKRVGNCRLSYRLGAGGIGLVYAGDQLSVGRRVAIKMLGAKAGGNEVLVQRFQREAKLSAQINHPGVVQVYDYGFDRGVHYQIMELVDGGTLANLIETHQRLPLKDVFDLGLQLAQALVHLHKNDIIHRDIKPANVLISVVNGRRLAKLADLGLAKQLDDDQAVGGLTMEGKPLGSPSYMPPEQVRNAKDATRASDIYGLGATMYAAITGTRPFDGKTSYEVMAHVLTKEVVPPIKLVPDLPPALNTFIIQCLSKDAAKRPQDAESVEQFFAHMQDQLLKSPGANASGASSPGSAAWKRPVAGVEDTTPPTFQQGGMSSSSRDKNSENKAVNRHTSQASSATWRRLAAYVPDSGEPGKPAPQAPRNALPGWAIGVIIALGVIIIALLVVIALK
jgi:serine/threonine protein kinase